MVGLDVSADLLAILCMYYSVWKNVTVYRLEIIFITLLKGFHLVPVFWELSKGGPVNVQLWGQPAYLLGSPWLTHMPRLRKFSPPSMDRVSTSSCIGLRIFDQFRTCLQFFNLFAPLPPPYLLFLLLLLPRPLGARPVHMGTSMEYKELYVHFLQPNQEGTSEDDESMAAATRVTHGDPDRGELLEFGHCSQISVSPRKTVTRRVALACRSLSM